MSSPAKLLSGWRRRAPQIVAQRRMAQRLSASFIRNRQAPVPVRIGARQADTKLTLFSWPGTARRATNRERFFFLHFHVYIMQRCKGTRWSIVSSVPKKELTRLLFSLLFRRHVSTSHLVNFDQSKTPLSLNTESSCRGPLNPTTKT